MVENNNMIYIKYELASRLYQLNESPIKILTPDSTLQALNISSHIDDEKHKKNFMETQQQLQNIINNYSSDNIKKINELLNNGIVVNNIVLCNLYKLFCENVRVSKKK